MRNFKKFAAVLASTALALSACSGGGDNGSEGGKSSFKACLVSDAGGWDDRSFNESAYNGLMQSKESLGIQVKTAESSSDADFAPNVEAMVADGCNMIIGVGFLLEQPLQDAAANNPDIEFGLVDSFFTDGDATVTVENGRPLVFNTAEAAYLAGYLAAGMTKTGTVATFGGLQIPSVTIFMDGFADGVAKYNEDMGTSVKLLGWDKASQAGAFTNSFDDQTLGKQQAQQFIDQGADVIMPVAGPVGLGAAAAAQEAGDVMFIGVDSDWFNTAPDYADLMLTSVMKEIAASVEDTIKAGSEGTFSSDPYVGTLENGGVSIAPYHNFEDKVPAELKDAIIKLEEQIKSGELKVESDASPKSN